VKYIQLRIPWKAGLHLRPAALLVRLVKASKSAVLLKVGEKVADARSVLAVLLLCAACGTVVNFEVQGEDEEAVTESLTRVFDGDAGDAK
jgi:phosphocarrier protein HPr